MILSILSKGEYSSLQWLAIAPLLALSATLTTGLVAGSMIFLLLMVLAVLISLLRCLVPYRLRVPVLIVSLGTLVCLMDMGMQLLFYELRGSFAIYLPLLAINSLIYAISCDYFFKNSLKQSLRQALITGTVFMMLFSTLGLFREAAGYATLFRDVDMLAGDVTLLRTIRLCDGCSGVSLIHTPPGALICCGLLAALIKSILKDEPPQAVTEVH
jgi:electron transport complex protein RnfE